MACAAALVIACASGVPAGHVPPASAADALVDSVQRVAGAFGSREAASRAGYWRIARGRIRDLQALAGEHWLNERYLRADSVDLAHPAYLLFYPLTDTASVDLVAVAYAFVQPSGAAATSPFPGGEDGWHIHVPCVGIPEINGMLTESVEQCEALGGRPGPSQLAMIHVWTAPPNPAGPFAHHNPALPFLATGLRPPSREALATPERNTWMRRLALALAETYGGLPRTAALLQFRPDTGFDRRAAAARERIRSLLPVLRRAEAARDSAAYRRIGAAMIDQWEHIRAGYLDAALSDGHRSLLARWFAHTTQEPMHETHD